MSQYEKQREQPGADVKAALRAAYEAGKAAARHFDDTQAANRAIPPETDREDWHH